VSVTLTWTNFSWAEHCALAAKTVH